MLSGVAIVSASNAWAVGSYEPNTSPRRDQTLIEHWTGRSWNRVTQPAPGRGELADRGGRHLRARNAWAVGAYANQVGGRNPALHRALERHNLAAGAGSGYRQRRPVLGGRHLLERRLGGGPGGEYPGPDRDLALERPGLGSGRRTGAQRAAAT